MLRRILIGAGVFFGLIVIGIIVLIFGLFQLGGLAPEAKDQVTTFLTQVSNGQYEKAYENTASSFKESMSYENFELAMTFYQAQYSGFKSQRQVAISWETSTSTGEVLTYLCEITYDDGDVGECTAVFVKENDEWLLHGMEVMVDLERLQKFGQLDVDAVLGIQSMVN